jgi:hypothetical protein
LIPAARRECASAVKSSPSALRTNSGCFAQWQLRVRTTEEEGTSRRSTTSKAEMRAHQPQPLNHGLLPVLNSGTKALSGCNVKARALGELPSEMLERNRLCSVLLSALLPPTMLLVDRGCDADRIRELSRQPEGWASIPPKRNRKDGPCLYRARNPAARE